MLTSFYVSLITDGLKYQLCKFLFLNIFGGFFSWEMHSRSWGNLFCQSESMGLT